MKKINRLLAFLLAFTVVITTFSSDLTAAHVYATEEEAVIDSEDQIKTVEKEEIPVVSEASTEESTEASTEGSTEEAATTADTGMIWQVGKVYTMPDGQPGVKIQRIS